MTIETRLEEFPVIAIIRGVTPDQAVEVGGILIDAGIKAIEVPLNSPNPFESIHHLVKAFPEIPCGAGTVLTVQQVEQLHQAGGRLCVSPNVNPEVIRRSVELDIEPFPGFQSPTEAFTAISAGARYLKLFPASTVGTKHLGALRAVIPNEIKIFAVGGVGAANVGEWLTAGIDGFGIASELFKPGWALDTIAERTEKLVTAVQVAIAKQIVDIA